MKRWRLILCLAFVAARGPENRPHLYNEGVTAYRSNEFATAMQGFEQALSSPDRVLQERAFYNLGNACYRLGEAQQPQAKELWERAIKSYESALALDPKDADAKFNLDFVKKKLEELQKQQQQQQQQQKDQQDQKQDQNKDQKKEDQQQQKQDQQSKDQQKQDQQKQDQKDQQQQKQDQQSKDQKDQKQQQQQQAQAQPDKLDKQQAKALLDNLRENEQNWNFFPELQMKNLKDKGAPVKDW